MQYKQLLALALSLASADAAYQGFNYGATNSDGSYKQQSDFQNEFKTAKNLVGTSGFTSARLYTTIQGGTTSDVISAIPAAIAEDTSLLLGLWASGTAGFDNELTALKTAISTYGDSLAKLVVGISVGSEDLYRNSPTGIEAKAGVGANPDTIVSYISQVRSAISGTVLSDVKIGHVDTWTAWANSSNNAVAEAVDWLGMDAYPYFQNTQANSIDNGKSLFDDALSQVQSAGSGKEVWITETGWPVSGPTENEAIANTANAKTYWDQVGCPLFGKTNTWWYTLQDAYPTTPSPSFGIVGTTLSTTPLYDLSCNATTTTTAKNSTSTTSAASNSTGTGAASSSSSSSGSSGSSSSGSSSGASSGSSSSGASSGSSSSSSGSSSGSGTGSYGASASGYRPASGSNSTWTASVKPSATGSAAAQFTNGASATTSGSMIAVIGAIFAAVQAL